MMNQFMRSAMLIGEEGVAKLARKSVAVFGVGGIGGFVCEALARAGIGSLTLFDDDVVSVSNLNRQITALHSTLGQPKTEVMARRIMDINPACHVVGHQTFYLPTNAQEYPLDGYDYVVDAVDTVTAKLCIIENARVAGVPVVSAMGAGNKRHPECFEVADIEGTNVCPLARVMRKEMRRRGISSVKVVYSTELPMTPCQTPEEGCGQAGSQRPGSPKTVVPGSMSFVPGAAGFVVAGFVVNGLLGECLK
jgi:tRNA A37 threonylcarbamoyladenosine dehydratase